MTRNAEIKLMRDAFKNYSPTEDKELAFTFGAGFVAGREASLGVDFLSAVKERKEGEIGFDVRSPCGRTWFVPLETVHKDYADFLVEQDGLSMGEAMAQAGGDQENLAVWFAEQWNLRDVAKRGRLTGLPTAEDVQRALDSIMAKETYMDYTSNIPTNPPVKKRHTPR